MNSGQTYWSLNTGGFLKGAPPSHPPFDQFFVWLSENLVVAVSVFLITVFISAIYLFLIWRQETADRVEWRWMIAVFIGGFTISVLIAFTLNYYITVHLLYDLIIHGNLDRYGLLPNQGMLVSATVMAPLTEEPAKILALLIVEAVAIRKGVQLFKYEKSGIVLGVACGLGFAASENVLYAFSAYYAYGGAAGILASGSVLALRSAVSTLGHAIFSGFFGLGYAKYRLHGDRAGLIKYSLMAIGLHSLFNLAASFLFGILVIMFLVPYLFMNLILRITEEEEALGIYHEEVEYSPAYYLPPHLRRDDYRNRGRWPSHRRTRCPKCGEINRTRTCVWCGYRPPDYFNGPYSTTSPKDRDRDRPPSLRDPYDTSYDHEHGHRRRPPPRDPLY